MASGDTIVQADQMQVNVSTAGKTINGQGAQAGLSGSDASGHTVAISATGSGGLFVLGSDITSPVFDPNKTYDLVIKEH
jgi:lipopolysaccharide export system protein LptA